MNGEHEAKPTKRAPIAFEVSDPSLIVEPVARGPVMGPTQPTSRRVERDAEGKAAAEATTVGGEAQVDAPIGERAPGLRVGWGTVLIGSLAALASLAAGVAFASFVSGVLERSDWIGIAGWSLLALAGVAGLVLAGREVIGLMRLGRLSHVRKAAEQALATRDIAAERRLVRTVRRMLGRRPELAWAASRFAEHEGDVRDPGDLLALADRELMAPLDAEARRLILASAKRVSLVTAMSPIAMLAMGFVLVENLGLLRRLATVYGGRPGLLGGIKLARMVLVHILATGGVALTDDLVGQLLGQDIARRLSRRLGEGLFNGALTARIGVAALDICRPLPFVEAKPVRIRDILAELTRRSPQRAGAEASGGSALKG
jgi:putative membrane protein